MNLMERVAISGYDFDHLQFSELLDLVESLGIGLLEVWPHNLPSEPMERVREVLADRGMAVICVNATVAFLPNKTDVKQAQAGITKAIELAETLGAPYVNTYLGANPQRDLITTIQLYRRNMQPCLEAAATRGITLVLENHFDNRNEDPRGTDVARRPETLLYLVEAVDSPHFKLTFDPCNFYIAGEEPYPYAYQLLRSHIGYVHLKDATRYYELLHGPDCQYKLLPDSITGRFLPVALGQGAVNFEGFLSSLAHDGYSGYLTVEPHTEQARLEAVCAGTLQYLRTHFIKG